MELPDFDQQQQSEAPAPRKPRPKPTKRRKVAKKKAVVKARKKRVAKPVEHAGGRYSKFVYDTIGTLMGMNKFDRTAVLEIVQGLSNERDA